MTTDDAIARFAHEYLDYHRISAVRARQVVKLLREFSEWADTTLTMIEPSDFGGFAADLVDRGFHVNTVRKKLNMIRPFFSWAYSVELIDADRYLKLKAIRDPRGASFRTTPKPYTRAEIEEFWRRVDINLPAVPTTGRGMYALRHWLSGKSCWNTHLWKGAMRLQVTAASRLALDLGLRKMEIFRLELADLHYDNDYLVVTGKADPHTGEPKIRTVPFTDAARSAVYEWVEFRALMRPEHNRPWVNCYWRDDFAAPMPHDSFKMLLQNKVGEGWRWHRLRHTCATNWLRAGTPLEMVSRLLGHATLEQTMAYAKIVKSDLAREMGKTEAAFAELVGPATEEAA